MGLERKLKDILRLMVHKLKTSFLVVGVVVATKEPINNFLNIVVIKTQLKLISFLTNLEYLNETVGSFLQYLG